MRFCLHGVARVSFIRGWPMFFLHAVGMGNCPGDINTYIVTKVAPVRAVDLSIGPFCTEFPCKQLFDEDIFREGVNFWAWNRAPRHKQRNCHGNGLCESCGPLDWTILHRISVRTFFVKTPLFEQLAIRVGDLAIKVGKWAVSFTFGGHVFFCLHAVAIVFYMRWPRFFLHASGRHPM